MKYLKSAIAVTLAIAAIAIFSSSRVEEEVVGATDLSCGFTADFQAFLKSNGNSYLMKAIHNGHSTDQI